MNNIKSRTVRISEDLDRQIRTLMQKNNIKYVDASKEIAKVTGRLNGKIIIKEIKF